ncbi:hypothetical protein BDV12DRAFT_176829 [Aspergillus spectabilis]
MPFDRVIQDSDDEDEPLGELSSEKTNRVPVINHVEQQGAKSPQGDLHIGVNFDQFLQTQNDPQMILSSSQQRREERWIPMAGRVGSMGTVMTEIGLAQQRLFDDDQAQYHEPVPFQEPEPELVQNINYEIPAQEETLNAYDLPPDPPQDLLPPPELHVPNPSDDWSQSAPSYNFFNSSFHTPSGFLNRADFIRDSGSTISIPTEHIQNPELRRWTSMQGAVSSPHDTEPFSSVITPKAIRANSDNLAANIEPSSPASVDELSLPVITEMPKVERRGRKKKQIPGNDEDDELSHQFIDPPPNKPEKHKPGRPQKNAKVPLEDTVNPGPAEPIEVPGPISEETQELVQSNTAEVPDGTAGEVSAPQMIIDGPPEDYQNEQIGVIAADQSLPSPPKPSKEPKKKKLKRGKTTSVTLTKTYEPDVEDDVIWIDERPISTANEDRTTPYTAKTKPDIAAEQPPAPKKRGRKRKKTSEQVEQEKPAPSPAIDEHATFSNEENTTGQDNEPPTKSEFSIVLDNKNTTTRTQAPDTPNQPQELEPLQQTSPTKPSISSSEPPETPQKLTASETPSNKGPGKHSPISSTSKVPLRVGLSKRARIAPLLKIIKR